MLLKFKVRGPSWSQGGVLPPLVILTPNWFDPNDPSPQVPTCDYPGRSFDNQIIACVLRAPTTGVFNISIIDNNHQHTGLRIAVVGTRLLDFDSDLSKVYGCEDAWKAERRNKWMCNHAAYITFKGQGLDGLLGTWYPPLSDLDTTSSYALVYNATDYGSLETEMGSVTSCVKVVITQTHVQCYIGTQQITHVYLKFYFQRFYEKLTEIDGQYGQSKVVFNMTAPLEVKFLDLEGWAYQPTDENPQVGSREGAEAVPALNIPANQRAVGTGWDTSNYEANHTIWVRTRPPFVESIRGVRGKACASDAHLTYTVRQYYMEYLDELDGNMDWDNTINMSTAFKPASVGYNFEARECQHGQIITIIGGGFAEGGTFIRWNSSAFTADGTIVAGGDGPVCWTTKWKNNREVRCAVALRNETQLLTRYTLNVNVVQNFGMSSEFQANTHMFPGVPSLHATFTGPTVEYLSGCLSGNWPATEGWGCQIGQDITIHGSGFYSHHGGDHSLTVRVTEGNNFVMKCHKATSTAVKCRADSDPNVLIAPLQVQLWNFGVVAGASGTWKVYGLTFYDTTGVPLAYSVAGGYHSGAAAEGSGCSGLNPSMTQALDESLGTPAGCARGHWETTGIAATRDAYLTLQILDGRVPNRLRLCNLAYEVPGVAVRIGGYEKVLDLSATEACTDIQLGSYATQMTILGYTVDTPLTFPTLFRPAPAPKPAPHVAYGGGATIKCTDTLGAAAGWCNRSWLFSLGGKKADGTNTDGVWAYDPTTPLEFPGDPWLSTVNQTTGWYQKASLPSARSCLAATSVPGNFSVDSEGHEGRYIYAFGGTTDGTSLNCHQSNKADRKTYLYDTHTDNWDTLDDVPIISTIQTLNMSNIGPDRSLPAQMFDIHIKKDIVLSGFVINIHNATVYHDVTVYYKSGTYVGSETTSGDWVQLANAAFWPGGTGRMALPGSFPRVPLSSSAFGGVYAFYIKCNEALHYVQPNFHADVAPGSPYITVKTGMAAESPFQTPDPVAGLQEFSGALLYYPSPGRCFEFISNNTERYNNKWYFTVPADVTGTISMREFTFRAAVVGGSAVSNIATTASISITPPHLGPISLFANVDNAASWPDDGPGWVKMESSSSSSTYTLDTSTSFPGASASTTYDSPRKFGTTVLDTIQSPLPAGIWTIEYQPGSPTPQIELYEFSMRVCWDQPGIIAAAAAAIDDNVIVSGGLAVGQFSLISEMDQLLPTDGMAFKNGTRTYIPMWGESFGNIEEMTLGIQVNNATGAHLSLYMILGPPAVGSELLGQWFADGTIYDLSPFGRHLGANQDINGTFFSAAYPDDPSKEDQEGHKVYNMYSGYYFPNFFGGPPHTESRTAWVRFNVPMVGWDWPVKAGEKRTITSFGCLKCSGIDHSWWYIQDGELHYEEASLMGSGCTLSAGGGLDDGQWHHIAMTRTAINFLQLYIDGVVVASRTCTVPVFRVDYFAIGEVSLSRVPAHHFRGMIYDVREYGSVLTSAMIKKLSDSGVGGQKIPILTPEGTGATANRKAPFRFQQFHTNGTTIYDFNFPMQWQNYKFKSERELSEVITSTGGQWLLAVRVECTGDLFEPCMDARDITWGLDILGSFMAPGSAVIELAGSTQTWVTSRSLLPLVTPRFGHVMVVYDGTVYAIGGAGSADTVESNPLASVEKANFYHGVPTWTNVASMNMGRYMPQAVVVGYYIYVMGGEFLGLPFPGIERYNILTDEWEILSQEMHTGRYAGIAGFFNQRMYITNGIARDFQNYEVYTPLDDARESVRDWSDNNNQTATSGEVEMIAFESQQPVWARMPGLGLVGDDCYGSNYDTSAGYHYTGAYDLGTVANEGECADKCEHLNRLESHPCHVYEYNTGTGRCHGRVKLGHRCGTVTNTAINSGYLNDVPLSLQTSFTAMPGSEAFRAYAFDFEVAVVPQGWITLKNLSLLATTVVQQQVHVYYRAGTHVGAQYSHQWTRLSPPAGITLSPSSAGRLVLPYEFDVVCTSGTHSLYIYYQVPGSLGWFNLPTQGVSFMAPPSTSTVVAMDRYLTLRAGTYRLSEWMPVLGPMVPAIALHYDLAYPETQQTRNKCYEPITMTYPTPWSVSADEWVLPFHQIGFKMFARVDVINGDGSQGLLHKSRNKAQVMWEGGLAVSLVDGHIAIKSAVQHFEWGAGGRCVSPGQSFIGDMYSCERAATYLDLDSIVVPLYPTKAWKYVTVDCQWTEVLGKKYDKANLFYGMTVEQAKSYARDQFLATGVGWGVTCTNETADALCYASESSNSLLGGSTEVSYVPGPCYQQSYNTTEELRGTDIPSNQTVRPGTWDEFPHGCYFKKDTKELYYNYGGLRNITIDIGRDSLCYQSTWNPIGPRMENGWHNFELTYDPSGVWTMYKDGIWYQQTVPLQAEYPQHDLYVGSEGNTDNMWRGSVGHLTFDCNGPKHMPNTFIPNATEQGIRAWDDPRISLQFEEPVTALGGRWHLQKSVDQGLYDYEVIEVQDIDISNQDPNLGTPYTPSIVTPNGRSIITTYLTNSNLTAGVRYQVCADVGLVRNARDAGVWQGLPCVAPSQGEWWFKVSDRYVRSEKQCEGTACATCDACRWIRMRNNGDHEYICDVMTSHGQIEVQRINVELKPTHDCP